MERSNQMELALCCYVVESDRGRYILRRDDERTVSAWSWINDRSPLLVELHAVHAVLLSLKGARMRLCELSLEAGGMLPYGLNDLRTYRACLVLHQLNVVMLSADADGWRCAEITHLGIHTRIEQEWCYVA